MLKSPINSKTFAAGDARGFTVIELIIVMGVIILLLALGVPSFNSMANDARFSKARQMVNGILTRAHIMSLSDRTLTAVRFAPGAWQVTGAGDSEGDRQAVADQQVAQIYQYRFTPFGNQQNIEDFVVYEEYFERMSNAAPVVLPSDVWVAPGEALLTVAGQGFDGRAVLDGMPTLQGDISNFEVDAAENGENLFDADDFMIVFDPEKGVMPSRWPDGSLGNPSLRLTAWQLKGLQPDPDPRREVEAAYEMRNNGALNRNRPFQRFNFSSVVIYPRKNFIDQPTPGDRQVYLREFGDKYFVNRNGGNLISGQAAERNE